MLPSRVALIRDVLARFTFLVDDKPATKLDKKIDKLKDKIANIAAVATTSFAAVGYGMYRLVDAASDAQESLNVLQQTFQGNSDAIVEWSKTMGKELGRSEFTLQDSVGKFGVFLQSMLKGTDADIASMSKKLSTLAVDLASFYNTSDEEAAMRLFSGISGETEAVRRLGVDISDKGLADFNKKKGNKGRYEDLSSAEKTMLRFEKIVADTVTAQGDAVRTADEWANSVRRVQDQIKDLAVRLGRRLMPIAKKVLDWVESFVGFIEKLTLKTSSVETFFLVMSVGLAATATKMALVLKQIVTFATAVAGIEAVKAALLSAGKAAALFALKAAAIVAVILAIEDFITFMRGGRSIFGTFLQDLTGLAEPLDTFNGALKVMRENIEAALSAAVKFTRLASGWGLLKFFWSGGDKEELWKDPMREGVNESERPGMHTNEWKEMRDSRALEAAGKGDKKAFHAMYDGQNLSDRDIIELYKQARQTALLKNPGLESNDEDYNAGLISKERWAADKTRRDARAKEEAKRKTDAEKKVGKQKTTSGPQAFVYKGPYAASYDQAAAQGAAGGKVDMKVEIKLTGGDEKKLADEIVKRQRQVLSEAIVIVAEEI